MAKQAIVIGLGQFGMAIARALAERDVEVFAIDLREDFVREAAEFAAEAVAFDATDAESLAATWPNRRDVSICAIGDEAREASIICTALLRQMGAPRVISRANNPLHERILKLVGAHVVVNPEREYGERFASRVLHEHVLGELVLSPGVLITELHPPPALVGRTLAELELPRRYGVTVVAVRPAEGEVVLPPPPNDPLRADDLLVVVSTKDSITRLLERHRS
ncbi:MAG TPA: TrkA family potassium uptake protein [Planctomycetota bacterium]|nr:TrkA family potassium uptake protein [Planctomycetota bacterium]